MYLVGGMERLNWHIADELSRYAQVELIGPSGAAALRPSAVPVTEVPLRPLPRFLLASAWQAVAVARRFQPHVRGVAPRQRIPSIIGELILPLPCGGPTHPPPRKGG